MKNRNFWVSCFAR